MKDFFKKLKEKLNSYNFFSFKSTFGLVGIVLIVLVGLGGFAQAAVAKLDSGSPFTTDDPMVLTLPWMLNLFGDWVSTKALNGLASIFTALKRSAAWLLELGAHMLEAVFNYLLQGAVFKTPFVQKTWETMRNFANMFFILWLVAIALATILDIKGWQAKKLLPKLILVALVINFSLLFSMVIIDFANASITLFAGDVTCNIHTAHKTVAVGTSLSGCLLKGLRTESLFDKKNLSYSDVVSKSSGNSKKAMQRLTNNMAQFGVLIIAAMVFLLLAIMMVVRIVALWLLMIVAPIAFAIGVIPPLAQWTKKWWSEFVKWAFYGLPVAFLLNIAVQIITAINNPNVQNETERQFKRLFSTAAGKQASGFQLPFFQSVSHVLQFSLTIIVMFIALKVAQSTASNAGDFVTNKVASWGNKAGKKAASWSGRGLIKAPLRKGGRSLQNAASRGAEGMLKSPKFKKLGRAARYTGLRRGLEGVASSGRQARKGRMQDAKSRLSNLSTEQVLNNYGTYAGDEKAAATKILADRDKLQEVQGDQAEDMKTVVDQSGDRSLRRKFDAQRFDLLKGEEEEERRIEAIKRASPSEWTEDFADNLDAELIEEFKEHRGTGALARAADDWTDDTQDAILSTIKSGFTDEDGNPKKYSETEDLRQQHAAISGNLKNAYESKVSAQDWKAGKHEDAIEESVSRMKSKEFDNLDEDDDHSLKLVARNISPSQVNTAGRKISAHAKDIIEKEVDKQDRKEVYEKMEDSDYWSV